MTAPEEEAGRKPAAPLEDVVPPHDPGNPEDYAGDPVADPWGDNQDRRDDGKLDPGSVSDQPA